MLLLAGVEELVALRLALIHKLALELLLHGAHHRVHRLLLRLHVHHHLLAVALHHHGLLEGDFQRAAVLWVLHHVQNDVHVQLTNAALVNKILHLEQVKSHLLSLLQELLSHHHEVSRNHSSSRCLPE